MFNDSTRDKDDIRAEWVAPGGTAIPGMTRLKDGDFQHSSASAQSPKEIQSPTIRQKLYRNRTDSRSRSDGRSRRYVQYRADQSQTETKISSLALSPSEGFRP